MTLIYDVDLPAAAQGAVGGVGDEFAGVVDAGVGGGVDLDDVGVLAAHDGLVGLLAAAGQGLGEDARGGGLADAAGAGEEVGVRDATRIYGILERPRDRLLADDFIEGPGAVAAGQHGVGHEVIVRGRRAGPKGLWAARGPAA